MIGQKALTGIGGRWGLILSLVASAALAPLTPLEAAWADTASLEFHVGSQTFVLTLPPGAVPALTELASPPRLVIDLPGVDVLTPRTVALTGDVATRYEVLRVAGRTRIVVSLKRPLRGAYNVSFVEDRMVIGLVRGRTPPVALLKPTPVPTEAPTPRPRPTPQPTPLPSGEPTPRITPKPVPWPSDDNWMGIVPSPAPSPSLAPTPTPQVVFTPEPLPSLSPGDEAPGQAVFGTRLGFGGDAILSLTEAFPNGKSASLVELIPGGGLFIDTMLTPNWGLSMAARAMSYTLEDAAATRAGFALRHRRDDYEGSFGVRGRWPLPWGFEVMAQPNLLIRTTQVSNTTAPVAGGDERDAPGPGYTSSSWVGYGGSFTGGLGWHIWGPLSLAGKGEYNYLYGGSIALPTAPAIFPMSGYRGTGELRLDFGPVGLVGGYGLTNWTHAGVDTNATLTQDWSGPYARVDVIF